MTRYTEYWAKQIRRDISLYGGFSLDQYLPLSNDEVQAGVDAARQALDKFPVESIDSTQTADFELTAFKILRYLVAYNQVSILTASLGAYVDEVGLAKVVSQAYGWRFTLWTNLGAALGIAFLVWSIFVSHLTWWQVIGIVVALYFVGILAMRKWMKYFIRARCLDTYEMMELCWETKFIAIFDETHGQTYSYHHSKTSFSPVILAIVNTARKKALEILSMEEIEKKLLETIRNSLLKRKGPHTGTGEPER